MKKDCSICGYPFVGNKHWFDPQNCCLCNDYDGKYALDLTLQRVNWFSNNEPAKVYAKWFIKVYGIYPTFLNSDVVNKRKLLSEIRMIAHQLKGMPMMSTLKMPVSEWWFPKLNPNAKVFEPGAPCHVT